MSEVHGKFEGYADFIIGGSPDTENGFCSKCGIIRQDSSEALGGVPITDCVCTAKQKHKEGCAYIQAVSMWVSIGSCTVHGLDACPECDCTCNYKI